MNYSDKILDLCLKCIKDVDIVLSTSWTNHGSGGFKNLNPNSYVDLEKFSKLKSNYSLLLNLLGNLAQPWIPLFNLNWGNQHTHAITLKGILHSIKESIEDGLLFQTQKLIFAEAFSNLLDQAKYLFSQGYLLASGVICRAIIEEKLRNICEEYNFEFEKKYPTINDLNSKLYKEGKIDKILYKQIDHLTSIGNEAAHNKPISSDQISDLIKGTTDLLLLFR